jgi:hypothetical protein
MAGPFSSVAEKRAHEMASNRAVSLDMTKAPPVSANHTPTHHSSDAIATAAAVTLINTGRSTKTSSPINYFRPAHSQITFGKMNFLITHQPSNKTIDGYISDLDRYHVTTLVRVCDPNYSADLLREHGIKVYDWEFEDGKWPPQETIQRFLQLCLEVFNSSNDCIGTFNNERNKIFHFSKISPLKKTLNTLVSKPTIDVNFFQPFTVLPD